MTQTTSESKNHVQNVMERYPITVSETDTIQVAVDKMIENHISAVPVVDENKKLKGILTVTDVLRMIQSDERLLETEDFSDDSDITVASVLCELMLSSEVDTVMTDAACTLRPEDSLEEAGRLMLQRQVHHLPVVNKEDELVGIVSTVHFVRRVAERN